VFCVQRLSLARLPVRSSAAAIYRFSIYKNTSFQDKNLKPLGEGHCPTSASIQPPNTALDPLAVLNNLITDGINEYTTRQT